MLVIKAKIVQPIIGGGALEYQKHVSLLGRNQNSARLDIGQVPAKL